MLEESKKLFLEKMADVLDVSPDELSGETKLDELDWDSLAAISAIALADECFGITIPVEGLIKCKTLDDVMQLAN